MAFFNWIEEQENKRKKSIYGKEYVCMAENTAIIVFDKFENRVHFEIDLNTVSTKELLGKKIMELEKYIWMSRDILEELMVKLPRRKITRFARYSNIEVLKANLFAQY